MSATASEIRKQLDDITECPICSNSFDDPRSLPCIHAFCLKCLEAYGRGKTAGTKMPCPLCRRDFEIPETGFSGLPKNFFIGKMQQIKRLSIGQRDNDVCEACEAKKKKTDARKEAIKYCIECEEKLCDSCSEDHLSHKMLRGHQIVDIDKMTGPDGGQVFCTMTTSCPKHKDQSLAVFCRDCKLALCVVCYIASHKQHDCTDFSDCVVSFRQQMTSDVGRLDQGIDQLGKLQASIQSQKECFGQHLVTAREVITRRAEEVKRQAEAHKQQLLEELDTKEQNITKQLDDLGHEITQHSSFMESLKNYTRELSNKGSAGDIAAEAVCLHSRVEELLEIDAIQNTRDRIYSIDVQFNRSTSLDKFNNLLGEVKVEVTPKASNQKKIRQLSKSGRTIASSVTSRTLTARGDVRCVTSLADQLFVVVVWNGPPYAQSNIEVFRTSTFDLLQTIQVPGVRQAFDMTSCAINKCLYVSDDKADAVYRVALSSGRGTETFTHWSINGDRVKWVRKDRMIKREYTSVPNPPGLHVNDAGNVLVTCSANLSLYEFTTDGSLLRHIDLSQERLDRLSGAYNAGHGNYVSYNNYRGRGEIYATTIKFAVQLPAGHLVVSTNFGLFSSDASVSQWRQLELDLCVTRDEHWQPEKLIPLQNGCLLVAVTDGLRNKLVIFDPSLTSAREFQLPIIDDGRLTLDSVDALHFDRLQGLMCIKDNGYRANRANPRLRSNTADSVLRVYENMFEVTF